MFYKTIVAFSLALAVLTFTSASARISADEVDTKNTEPADSPKSNVGTKDLVKKLNQDIVALGELKQKLDATQHDIARLNATIKDIMNGGPISGVAVLAILFIGSYLVNRFTRLVMGLLPALSIYESAMGVPNQTSSSRERSEFLIKLGFVYYFFAVVIAFGLTGIFIKVTQATLIASLKFDVNPVQDIILTGIILVVGADQIAQFFFDSDGISELATNNRVVDAAGQLAPNGPTLEEPVTD